MSSATILFVLEKMLQPSKKPQTTLLATAFGSGLTIEMAQLQKTC